MGHLLIEDKNPPLCLGLEVQLREREEEEIEKGIAHA
jgi:hypothetical protein